MNSKHISNNKLVSISTFLLVLGFNLSTVDKSAAIELIFSPTMSGTYGENGSYFQDNTNYFVGDCGDLNCDRGNESRDFFVFDTTGFSFNNINSAKLKLQIPNIEVINNVAPDLYPVGSVLPGFLTDSPEGEELYQLFDVSTDIPTLTSGHDKGSVTGMQIFADLGTGDPYSEETIIDDSYLGNFLDVDLNQNAISKILSGGEFAFGGAIKSLDDQFNNEYSFAHTNPAFNALNPNAVSENNIQLVIETDEVAITAEERGFLTETGVNFGNGSYFAGDCKGVDRQGLIDGCTDFNVDLGESIRNYFVFDLSKISEITPNSNSRAFLQLQVLEEFIYEDEGVEKIGIGFYTDARPQIEFYTVFDFTGDIDELVEIRGVPNVTGSNLFTDLGTGNRYSREFGIRRRDIGEFVDVPLNRGGFATDIINSLGGKFALGGAITSLNTWPDFEMAFSFTNNGFGQTTPESTQLIIRDLLVETDPPGIPLTLLASNAEISNAQSTPEPTSVIGLFALGALGLFGRKNKENSDDK